ncbi:MAG: ATP cone domain-containing protein [Actinobacteria bacterium]|nr:ATP cone domain-containing protein [Actinomycetota bacterium]
MAVASIIKRDGRSVPFKRDKIESAILKALRAVGRDEPALASRLAGEAVDEVDRYFTDERPPHVEEVQDIVERTLIKADLPGAPGKYIIYRERRADIRATKRFVGVADDLKVGVNAAKVLNQRYLKKDESGRVVETPSEMFHRVAKALAAPDQKYDEKADIKSTEEAFYRMMASFDFLPNSPTLMNAGTPLGQLAACFVIPVGDSITGIFDAVKWMAQIHQTGGGVGYSFTRLRPKGDIVRSTKGIASGPVSFMRVFDVATDVIKQGGRRRGANMGILRCDHPDILEFVTAKRQPGFLTNFNVSVAATDEFMKKAVEGGEIELVNPRTGVKVGRLSAPYLFDVIVASAWTTGDPGLFFIDRTNEANPTPNIGQFESTNPCVVGSTRIATSDGLVTMEELFISKESLAVLTRVGGTNGASVSTEQRVLPAVPVFKTGSNQPVYRVETKHGFELTATGNHRFLTPNGFVELKDLKIGDELYLQAGEGLWSEKYDLPPFLPEHHTAKGRYAAGIGKGKIRPPARWPKELGQLLGWAVGDGFLTLNSGAMVAFTFGEAERHLLPHFRKVFADWFGAAGYLREQRGSMQMRYKGFPARFLANLGLDTAKSHEKKVPESIWSAPREAVAGFMQGLFTTDGTVNLSEKKGSCSIRLASSSKALLQEVQLLLLNFGIISRLHLRREQREAYLPGSDGEPKRTKTQPQYELIIDKANRDRFIDQIGFMSDAKQAKAESFIRAKKRKSNRETFTTTVASVEFAGYADVYDTMQPFTHTVIYNGIITHQCGEVPLLPFESCNLGSINLSKMLTRCPDGTRCTIDWEHLKETVHLSVHFLDNVIDASLYPLTQIDEITKANRKIGLGVMGFAEMLLKLGIAYDSEESVTKGEEVMAFIYEEAKRASVKLAEARGSFPNFKGSKWEKAGYKRMRNATVTTIAPTGTIGIIAGTSSGIEPIFAISYARQVMEGTTLLETNATFEEVAKARGFSNRELMLEIAKTGTVRDREDTPEDVRRLFATAFDVAPEWHVQIQAVFQKYTDNAVSKTVNLPQTATMEDVRRIYLMAYELGCKGITIYRYGSKPEQVLYIGTPEEKRIVEQPVTATSEFSGGCAYDSETRTCHY